MYSSKLHALIVAAGFAAFLTSAASPQTKYLVANADIPFAFSAAHEEYPSGEYILDSSVPGFLSMRSADGKFRPHVALIQFGDPVKRSEARLIFAEREGKYVLREIWGVLGKSVASCEYSTQGTNMEQTRSVALTYPASSAASAEAKPSAEMNPVSASAIAGNVPVSMVVSVGPLQGGEMPPLALQQVKMFLADQPTQIRELVPLGDGDRLELLILIDEAVGSSMELQLADLRHFIAAQPAGSAIAIAYIKNEKIRMAQEFTTDHARAAEALRAPADSGAELSDPYASLTEMIERWPAGSARRAVLLISSGINPGDAGPNDAFFTAAIAAAQRTGTQVYGVLEPAGGAFGQNPRLTSLARTKLSELAEDTGGELYLQAFSPLLEEFGTRLAHQYRLTFLAPAKAQARYDSVRLEATADAKLFSASRIYIPAGK